MMAMTKFVTTKLHQGKLPYKPTAYASNADNNKVSTNLKYIEKDVLIIILFKIKLF